jgi:hypothetical protein
MTQTVAAISIQRRTVAVAVFRELHLEGVVVRHIPSDTTRAENTIVGFAHEMCSHYKISAVAIETNERATARLERSYACARKAFEDESVSLHEVPLRELMESYAYRPLKLRQQLRRIARKIWPVLENKRYGITSLDAALVGLCAQTKRLLNINPDHQ